MDIINSLVWKCLFFGKFMTKAPHLCIRLRAGIQCLACVILCLSLEQHPVYSNKSLCMIPLMILHIPMPAYPTSMLFKKTIENPRRLPLPTCQLLIILFPLLKTWNLPGFPYGILAIHFGRFHYSLWIFPHFPFIFLSKVFLTKGNIQGDFLISHFLNDCNAVSMYNKDILFHIILNFLVNTTQYCIHLFF